MAPNVKTLIATLSAVLLTGKITFASELPASDLSTAEASKQALLSTETTNRMSFSAVDNAPAAVPTVYVISQPLPAFLRQAARRNGYQITLSKRVRGVLKKRTLPMDIRKILPEIGEQFDLKWHFQQKQLFVSIGAENTTRLIYLGQMKMDQLREAMQQADIESDAYDLSYVSESNSVLVNGSVSYIASLELIAESYNKNLANRKSNVKVIRYGTVGN